MAMGDPNPFWIIESTPSGRLGWFHDMWQPSLDQAPNFKFDEAAKRLEHELADYYEQYNKRQAHIDELKRICHCL